MDWTPWILAAGAVLLLLGAKRIFWQSVESSGRLKKILNKDE